MAFYSPGHLRLLVTMTWQEQREVMPPCRLTLHKSPLQCPQHMHENYQDIVSSQSSTDPKMLLRPLTFLLLTISSAIPLTPHELEARENDQNGTV